MAKDYPKYEEERITVLKFAEANGFYTTPEKSRQMSRIRAKNTKPELMFRKALWATGLRYRTNVKKLPGSPDIVIKKYKLAIFIDGDFWHGYDWEKKKAKLNVNKDFWIPKIERNMQRDRENNSALTSMGYTVFRFWEGDVKQQLGVCITEILNFILLKKEGFEQ